MTIEVNEVTMTTWQQTPIESLCP